MALHRDLIKTNRLERRRSCAYAAYREALHALDYPADRREIVQILRKRLRERMNDMGLHDRVRHFVLLENVRNREFSAESVAAVLEVHFSDLIGISLHKNRYACVLKRRDSAVFVDKYRHTENHAVVLALMRLEPFCVSTSLVAGFDRTVAGRVLVHDEIIVTGGCDCLYHILSCALDELGGHKAPVSEI